MGPPRESGPRTAGWRIFSAGTTGGGARGSLDHHPRRGPRQIAARKHDVDQDLTGQEEPDPRAGPRRRAALLASLAALHHVALADDDLAGLLEEPLDEARRLLHLSGHGLDLGVHGRNGAARRRPGRPRPRATSSSRRRAASSPRPGAASRPSPPGQELLDALPEIGRGRLDARVEVGHHRAALRRIARLVA